MAQNLLSNNFQLPLDSEEQIGSFVLVDPNAGVGEQILSINTHNIDDILVEQNAADFENLLLGELNTFIGGRVVIPLNELNVFSTLSEENEKLKKMGASKLVSRLINIINSLEEFDLTNPNPNPNPEIRESLSRHTKECRKAILAFDGHLKSRNNLYGMCPTDNNGRKVFLFTEIAEKFTELRIFLICNLQNLKGELNPNLPRMGEDIENLRRIFSGFISYVHIYYRFIFK